MPYDQYPAKGLPSASDPGESAGKNLIQDRMQRSGMRWTEAVAEAIVKLRAIYLAGISTSTGLSTFKKSKADFIQFTNGPSSQSSHTQLEREVPLKKPYELTG